MFSVPLSVRFPCPGVTRRTALWSSDFPPAYALSAPADKPLAGLPTETRSAKVGDRLADCDLSIMKSQSPNPKPKSQQQYVPAAAQ